MSASGPDATHMTLGPQEHADIAEIIKAGMSGDYPDVKRAHAAYVRFCHLRQWSGDKARAIYDAWYPTISKLATDDIPF